MDNPSISRWLGHRTVHSCRKRNTSKWCWCKVRKGYLPTFKPNQWAQLATPKFLRDFSCVPNHILHFIIIHSVSFHMTSASLCFINQQMHRYKCIKNLFFSTLNLECNIIIYMSPVSLTVSESWIFSVSYRTISGLSRLCSRSLLPKMTFLHTHTSYCTHKGSWRPLFTFAERRRIAPGAVI